MRIEIFPLQMVTLDDKKIELGMNKKTVSAIWGKGDEIRNQVYYFDSDLRIDYDKKNCVEFIEFLGGVDGKMQPIMDGVPVFRTTAKELCEILKSKNNGLIIDNENGYSYGYAEISVGVYRESIPENVEEMIEEASADGYPLSEEEIKFEMKRANYFATFGIGIAGYYKK